MNRLYIHIIFLLFVSTIQAQNNLVINGNFEDTITCPPARSNSYLDKYLVNWQSANQGNPDYYNRCSSKSVSESVHIPESRTGYQEPVSGDGYSGFFLSFRYIEMKEYITGKLKKSLISASTYLVSFFLSTADNSSYAIDFIGAYLSNDSISQSISDLLPYSPQIESDSGYVLDYQTTWHEIKGLYKAKGGEKYITLGCFRAWDMLTWKTYNPPNYISEGAYYYIDSVTVILYQKPDTIIPPKNPHYTLFPNPASDKVTISFEDIEPKEVAFELFDMLGRKVLNVSPQLIANKFETNIQFLAAGVYAYRLKVDGAYMGDGKLIIVR